MANMGTPKKKKKGRQGEGGGRPSKLNADVSKNLCRLIKMGMSYQHACDGTRISYHTFLSWKAKANNAIDNKSPSKYTVEEQKLVKFLDDIKEAEAKGVEQNLQRIISAADEGAWQAGAWILERRHPDTYAKHEKIDQKTEYSGGMSIQLQMTDAGKKKDAK